MAQLANLPSRLFHILFGQPPREGEKAQDRKQWIKNTRRRKECCKQRLSLLRASQRIEKRFYGCQLKIKVVSLISSTATQCQNNNSTRTRTQYSKSHFFFTRLLFTFDCSFKCLVKKWNIQNNSALHVLLWYPIITTKWHLMNNKMCYV